MSKIIKFETYKKKKRRKINKSETAKYRYKNETPLTDEYLSYFSEIEIALNKRFIKEDKDD